MKKTALITGSSRGIGLGIAKALASSGFNILLNAPAHSDALQEAEQLIAAAGASVKTLVFDIGDVTRHAAFVEQAWNTFGEVHCLVNNAGVSVQKRGDLLDLSVESFDEQININLRGAFFLTQAFAKMMVAKPCELFRSIITISSSNAEAVSIERGEYCIAKSGLGMMNKLFAVRLAPEGVHCYEVCPGLIATDMTAPVKEKYDALLEKGFSPINRWGTVEDVAEVVKALAEGQMQFVTGEAIHVDGGLLIKRY